MIYSFFRFNFEQLEHRSAPADISEQLISRTYASYDIWEGWENSVPGLNELIFMFLSIKLTVYSFITNQTT